MINCGSKYANIQCFYNLLCACPTLDGDVIEELMNELDYESEWEVMYHFIEWEALDALYDKLTEDLSLGERVEKIQDALGLEDEIDPYKTWGEFEQYRKKIENGDDSVDSQQQYLFNLICACPEWNASLIEELESELEPEEKWKVMYPLIDGGDLEELFDELVCKADPDKLMQKMKDKLRLDDEVEPFETREEFEKYKKWLSR